MENVTKIQSSEAYLRGNNVANMALGTQESFSEETCLTAYLFPGWQRGLGCMIGRCENRAPRNTGAEVAGGVKARSPWCTLP